MQALLSKQMKKNEQDVLAEIATHIAQTNGKSNRAIATNWRIQGKISYETGTWGREVGRLLGETTARGGQEEALRGMQIRGGAAGAGVRRDSGGGVGSGARLRSPRGGAGVGGVRRLPSTLAFQPVTAALPRRPSAVVRLDWIGLGWLVASPLPTAAFPPSAPRLPSFCCRGLFALWNLSPPPSRRPAARLPLLASASARPKRLGWWRLPGSVRRGAARARRSDAAHPVRQCGSLSSSRLSLC